VSLFNTGCTVTGFVLQAATKIAIAATTETESKIFFITVILKVNE
jgi:hypothetical protein